MQPALSKTLRGTVLLPGDKSISHRALMLLGIAQGTATIENLSAGQDVMSTLACMQALGCSIEPIGTHAYEVTGQSTLKTPQQLLDCGNSGTTIRLLSGLLAGAEIPCQLSGDVSLQKRPMRRVITPLSQMGSPIKALGPNDCAPIEINASQNVIHGIEYASPMASAQVKSAVLFAGLFTDPSEIVSVIEPLPSRDHSERMLTALGADVQTIGNTIHLRGRQKDLMAQPIWVPGDISSAAFWIVGAAILRGASVTIQKVGLNPSRLGLLQCFKQAGVSLTIENAFDSANEPCGDLKVEAQPLKGDITITPQQVPALIDEIPILTILGLFTEGMFTVRGAEELRVKESDRLGALVRILQILGVDVEEYSDGFMFQGNANWTVPPIESAFKTHHDHRLVMALEILNLRASKPFEIEGREWASISYPTFFETLSRLTTTTSC